MKITFTNSKLDEADILSALAIESKGHWGYSREQLEIWRKDLRITPGYIAENTVRTIWLGTERVGFFAIQQKEDAILDHLWLHPSVIGQGIGSETFREIERDCRKLGIQDFIIVSDPNAEGFYLRQGAVRIGEVESIPQNRFLPKLLYRLGEPERKAESGRGNRSDAKIVGDTYNRLGSAFDTWAESVRVEERAKYISKVGRRLHSGAKILDVGCGNGLLNTRCLSANFDVVGIDVSERQICEAKRNLPGVEFHCGDVRDCTFTPCSFDAIVSFYCFNHIARESYPSLLQKFHDWLRPDGLLVCSFGITDTAGWIGEWLGTTTFFSSHERERTLSIVKNAGFCVEEEVVEMALEDGEEASFLWIIGRKPHA